MKSLRWTDWAILACFCLSIAIGGAALAILVETQDTTRGVMDGGYGR